MNKKNRSIIIFDGICNLCNGFIDFIIKHDRNKYFELVTNQSQKGKTILMNAGIKIDGNETVYLFDNKQVYTHSKAVLKVLKDLGFPWSIFYCFIIIPTGLRDAIYRFIASRRYKWFGKREICRIIDQEK